MIPLLFLLLVPCINGDRVVQTNSGPIRGISLDTKNVEAFLGIPFAEPPVGKLRFAKPVPKLPWTETLHAKKLSPACVQSTMEIFNKIMNESVKMDQDCLYLNLWVPKSKSTLKPIMVWIYGGGFMTGTANMKLYDGAALADHGDVIVASMNYRVGTLGFFSAFIDEAAGNMGMYDQVLAIQWIKDNAKNFGGDPDNIVLFGESAGAYSVSLHMVSPLSKNLFKRGIVQSGAAIPPMFSDTNDVLRKGSLTISKHVGCAADEKELEENPRKVVDCMKRVPPEKFAEGEEAFIEKMAMLIPRVGDEFLPKTPTDLFRRGEFKDTEVLLGVTRDEGTFQLGYLNVNGEMFGETIDGNAFNETRAREFVQSMTRNEAYDKIIQNYFKRVKEVSRYTYLNAVTDIVGDSLVTCTTMFLADFQSLKKNPAYFYVFDYRSPSSRFPEWMGVPHFEEVPYVFGNPYHKTFSEAEENLIDAMMDMWASFARKGNPSIPGGLKWPRYTYEDPKYLIIGMSDKVGVRPDNYRCEAWRNVYRSTIDEEVIQNFRRFKTEL